MTNSNETSQDEYDEILRKLEILLSRHQSASSTSRTDSGDRATARPSGFSGTASNHTPTYVNIPTLTEIVAKQAATEVNIPTLTEVVHSVPSTLSPADITRLLEQILNTALQDAGGDLNPGARQALIQALKSRLFGL